MNFIEKIRKSDNHTKLRYIVVCSSVAGILVFTLWAVSLRDIIESATAVGAPAQRPSRSLIVSVKSAWAGLKENTRNTIDFFKEKATEKNEVIITKE